MKKCLFLSNQNIYDFVNVNGLLYYLSLKYDIIYVVINSENMEYAYIIFKNIINLIFIENNYTVDEKYNDCEIIKLGNNNKNCIRNLSIDNVLLNYFQYFYQQLNLDYEIKYKYENLERDFKEENKYYKKVKNLFKEGYIFYYDFKKNFIIDDSYSVFNPIYNYYEEDSYNKDKWIDIEYKNIFNLLEIIENAEEIHLFDINLFSIMPFLNLNNVKNKYIYHNNIMIKEYHKNLKDFKFIYYNN